MRNDRVRTMCWVPLWNEAYVGVGLEHLIASPTKADGCILAIDEDGTPFRLHYRLTCDEPWRLRAAELTVWTGESTRSLSLGSDGHGRWQNETGSVIAALDGCIDIDIWPTPFTNSFPILREPLAIGERREFRMTWIAAPALSFESVPQAYTRLAANRYLFENLDGSGFRAELLVDDDGFVIDYPGFFRRVSFEASRRHGS